MCGILALIGSTDRQLAKRMSQKMSHRGPDEHGYQVVDSHPRGAVLCHERLSIIDLHTGRQPIEGSHGDWMVHNGEIYNHVALR
jgi:asparagine synthase (glutamine-hydrolysing)